ncbi:MAG: hypothetical protein ACR2RV_28880 [Verrucomicrobiales bacterium]
MRFAHWLAVLSMSAVSAMAEVPRGTYPIGHLDKAMAEAREKQKALAFLVSDPDSEYRKTQQATSLAIKELRNYAVIIFLTTKVDGETAMPPTVVTELRQPTMGTFDPRIVLLSADLKEALGAIGSDKIVGDAAYDTYRYLKRTMRAKLAGWKASDKPPAQELIWVRADGRHYRGRFVEVSGGRLRVESDKFGKGSLALGELAPGSLRFARQLSEKGGDAAPEESGHKIETWTSSDGKAVEARFVSLENDEITVETDAGKSYTFPLERLDRRSRMRAEEIAGRGR